MFALIERSSGPDVSPIGKCSHVWLLGGLCVWTLDGGLCASEFSNGSRLLLVTDSKLRLLAFQPLLPSDLQPEPDTERKTPPRLQDTLRWMLMPENQTIRAGVVGEDAGAGAGAGVH